jgi:hypothetical protein
MEQHTSSPSNADFSIKTARIGLISTIDRSGLWKGKKVADKALRLSEASECNEDFRQSALR